MDKIKYTDFSKWAEQQGWFYAGKREVRGSSIVYHSWVTQSGKCVGVAVKFNVTAVEEQTGNIQYVEEIVSTDD